MDLHSKTKALLALTLSLTILATGCSAQWIDVALADLPVLVQMALNIASLVTTLQSGNQISASEAANIQRIADEAGKDLSLLQTLYNDYKAHPSPGTLQRIQSVIADLNANLPALLQAVHISNPTLATRVAAAVGLIQTTVASFAALVPHPAASAMAPRVTQQTQPAPAIVQAKDLKKQWNKQVCAPTGDTRIDPALSSSVLR